MQAGSATKLFLFLIWSMAISACDKPTCKNTNPVFDRYAPDRLEYRQELAKQIRLIGADKLKYWVDKYTEREGRKYLSLFVQGDGLCAKGEMAVLNEKGLEQLIAAKGNSYSGAELKGLQLGIKEDSADVVFTYQGLDRIID